MTTNDPEKIRQDIERTRANLSDDVNALADTANPRNIAQAQVDKAKETVSDKVGQVKEKVFGSDDDYYDNGVVGDVRDRATGAVDDARGRATDAVDGVRQNVADAPRQVRRNTRGNPLAAGLVAFGLGALVGGLMPASDAEKRAAGKVKEQAAPVIDQAKDVAKDAAGALQQPATDALNQVKDAATGAADNVKDEARFAAQDVQETAQSAKDEVKDQANQAMDKVQKN